MPRYIDGPLGAGSIGVGLGVGAFALTAVLLRPWSGRFGDVRGRGLPIMLGSAIHTFGMAGLLLAHNLPVLVGVRLFTGFGEALFFVGASAAIQDLAPDDRRGEAASLFSLSLFSGLAIGPVVGEALLDAFSFDVVWMFCVAVSLFGFAFATTVPDTRTDTSAPTGPQKLINRAALRPGLILGCAIFGLAAFNSFVPLYALQVGLGGSRYLFLTNAIVILLIRSFGARLPDRLGHLRTARFSLACTPIGMAIMGIVGTPAALFAGAVFQGIGQALAFPALMALAINNAPPNERGSVMGTFTAFFDIAFGGGSVALGALASVLDFRGAFLGAMVMATVGFTILLVAPPPVRRPIRPVAPVIAIEPPGE